MFKKPHGTKLVKYSPGDIEDSSEENSGEHDSFEGGYSFWGFKTKGSKKAKKSHKHSNATAEYGTRSEDAYNGSSNNSSNSSNGAYGNGAYGSSATVAAAAPQKAESFRVDSRLWPDEKMPAASSGATEVAAAAAEVAATAAATPAATTADPGVDTRLWPDDATTPWAQRAAPVV